MTRTYLALVAAILAIAGVAQAQSDSILNDTKSLFAESKNNVLRSAEEMPESNYSFRPTPAVRSFGQIVAHVADWEYRFCAPVRGEQKSPDLEKTKTTKADIVAAFKDASAYCDAALASLTPKSAASQVTFLGRKTTKLGLLNENISHLSEHYGNLVTYLRIKGLVPPSSQNGRQ